MARMSRFSVEQMVAAVKQEEAGTPNPALRRKLGIFEQTFYRWKE